MTTAPASQGFDLAEAQQLVASEEEGADVALKNAAGHPMFFGDGEDRQPVTMTVRGWHSPTVRKLWADAQERVKLAKDEPTAEESQRRDLAFAAACVVGWSGFFNAGAPLAFTRENVLAALSLPWIYAQVDAAVFEHQRFFPSSPSA